LRDPQCAKVFWFFFQKRTERKHFFLKKEAKTLALKADAITADSAIVGWALAPVVTVWRGRRPVAEARACLFRPDLLRAGYGHGHYGFVARLHATLPPGRVALTLTSGEARLSVRLAVPPRNPRPPLTVEALLAPSAAWTVADFLAKPDCLPWADQLASMGEARFVDAAFRFALHRWPSAAESSVHARALARGAITAEGFVVKLLRSRERADMKPALMSPFDPDFLFDAGSASGNLPATVG
jgi:hypothetical protein